MNSHSDKWISLGTINHEEGNKTTLSKLIGSIGEVEKMPRLVEEKPRKHPQIAVVGTDKVYLSLLLSKENIINDKHINLISREEYLAKSLKDIQIEEKPRKHHHIAVVGTDKVYLSLLLSKENILNNEHIDLISREEYLAKSLKDIQIEDISKNNKNNKLVLSPKEYGQRLKKKGR